MKKTGFLTAALVLLISGAGWAAESNVLLDDFEIVVSGGADGTVDFGAGNGSSIQVIGASDIKNSGKQALKVDYDAVSGGYMYIARGAGLDAKNANWAVKPSDIKWEEYSAVSFYVYGTNSKAKIAFDIKDTGGEIWRFIADDDFAGWKKVVVSFDKFIVRDDWQPQDADQNGVMDFPIRMFQFEPLPGTKGTLYFDTVELVKK
ncbi:MAG TPA: carbohydrate binding domain-containing protein [Candidatus Omnitrophota bacterium]|nr:carbohydrate binding domain-containing protein [Candidatus Omnitrophota bacterium]HPT38804.1 carbohydrate binding domain-containing protein [Candidatus Omnitrophota bacterium]